MRAGTTTTGALHAARRAERAKDQMYLARRGFLYTSSSLTVESAAGFAAVVMLTANREAFDFHAAGRKHRLRAVAAKPMVTLGLRVEHAPFVNVGLSPNHALYRRFRAIPAPGCLVLERDAYGDLDDALWAASEGGLPITEAIELFERVAERTARFLPPVKPADARIERALELLRENPNFPLKDLAAALGLSYDRMSHLFTEGVGLPLRSYLLWQKLHTVASLLDSGRTLTEIALAAGFTDSAHLSNTWLKVYGTPPSYFLNPENVAIHSLCKTAPAHVRAPPPLPFAEPQSAEHRCRHCGSPLPKPARPV